jgi:hypothetical protein
MKKLTCTLSASLCVLLAMAQYTVPQVLGASGGSGRSATVKLDWTVGETITATHKTSSLTVTQGFHQGKLRLNKQAAAKLPDEAAYADLDIRVFPNPTYDYVTLLLPPGDLQDYNYVVYDMAGQEQFQGIIEQETVSADFTTLAKATYLLVVRQRDVPVKVFQIIKN